MDTLLFYKYPLDTVFLPYGAGSDTIHSTTTEDKQCTST